MTPAIHELLMEEESKRERMWHPLDRWRILQETIEWAEKQLLVPRNSPAARLAEQARKLQAFRQCFGDKFTGVSR